MSTVNARATIRLTPRASRDEVVGEREGVLVVRVAAPPVDGAANEALVRVLAKALGLPRRDVVIVSGATSRTKIVEVAGLDVTEVRRRLQLDGEVG